MNGFIMMKRREFSRYMVNYIKYGYKYMISRWMDLWSDETGLGTVEMVLILAVLVGIALIFRGYIFSFVSDIMSNIMGGDVEAIRSNPVKP